MATIKFSRQRESIKEYLANTKEHPTADMVYMHIRNIYPNISLGTVYRNLNLLAEQGEIIKLSHGTGSDRFDGNTLPHYHFVCTECSCVEDLDIAPEVIKRLNQAAGSHFNGRIEGNSTFFYGKCSNCIPKS
ncbi:transcriptional repressor [Anaerocolumna cellulosilytica]|uniref:Transcriptional repressor n=1 Tax=Anaerocolumna cellulosilytica TaxID=433286 RepID=A0A6S6R021_9FIRM|nr:transcriptional repressor [Anaerocolumna cellulosilytica]MBB5195300.1 Fur family peroxide stress response transcriptional regulator [Anaerocolumna cellulosilytica]BCJ96773.1 transcriptional repressor [Anaerocolumna cellulosilytica]